MRILKSQNGQSIILVLIAIAALGFMTTSILDLIKVSREQKAISANIIGFRSALNSIVDYTIAGVKQRACFDTTNWFWTAAGPACSLDDLANSERLILNDESASALKDYEAVTGGSLPITQPFRVQTITSDVIPFSSINPLTHPLGKALGAITRAQGISGFTVSITRNESVTIPQHGRDIQISITARIEGTTVLARGFDALTETSTILVMPREVSQFALIVPQDMRLDATSAQSAQGDANINGSAGGMINFMSPVFINRDLYLPPTGTTNPVIFSGKVVLGQGSVKQAGGTLLTPSLGGSADKYYDQIPGVTGIMAGVETDGSADAGLNAFAGNAPPAVFDAAPFTACQKFSKVMSDLKLTKDARTVIQQSPSGPFAGAKQIYFTMGLTQGDVFPAWGIYNPTSLASKQLTIKQADTQRWPPPSPVGSPPNGQLSPIARITVKFVSPARTYTGYVPGGCAGGCNLTLQPGLPNTPWLKIGVDLAAPINVPPGSSPQPNAATVSMLTNSGAVNHLSDFSVSIATMDLSYFAEASTRILSSTFCSGCTSTSEQTVLNFDVRTDPATGFLNLQVNGAPAALNSGSWSHGAAGSRPAYFDTDPSAAETLLLGTDYAALIGACPTITQSKRDQSFPTANWGAGASPFTDSTRVSWNFANPTNTGALANQAPANPPTFNNAWVPGDNKVQIFDATTSPAVNGTFYFDSIKDVCQVRADATIVAGFLACDVFEILPRTLPLTIIGTVIAGRLNIDPTAIASGIVWRSIYHPQSIIDLQSAYILHPYNLAVTCNTFSATNLTPIWNPNLTTADEADAIQCSPVWLRHQAEPFTWSQVDPDCGVVSGQGSVSCQHRPRNFIVHEIGRSSNL